ncbi:hypothetical protein WA026_006603 [Henosepilachna vigintioctopunctata]|uniref:Tetraspanin n=1 Tax=Henosepilachna vigintioctopunctata TaxID=420089 RepID=A0AAW1UG57_9CUCU
MEHNFQTMATMACLKSLLMIFNFIFWISGIVIMIVGIWMAVDLYKYMELSIEYSKSTPYVLIIMGAGIFLIGSFACCCTLKGQPKLLYVYGGILAVIFMLELGCGVSIYAYRDNLTKGFDSGLNQAMRNYNNNSRIAEDIDIVQRELHCCGNHEAKDWINVAHSGIPESCCKKEPCNTRNDFEINQEGCYDNIVKFLSSNITTVVIIAMSVTLFPLIGIILSCCLACLLNKHKYEQMA